MSIDWRRYFDHIYCIHYLGDDKRLPGIIRELERVGILGSGIFSFVHTSRDPWERFVVENCPRQALDDKGNRGFINLGLATARALREALALEYSRVLFMEDDVRFLKDTGKIEKAMEEAPEWDIVQFDKFVDWGMTEEQYQEMVKRGRIEGSENYFDGGTRFLPSGACVSLNEKAMRLLCKSLEEQGPRPIDGLFGAVGARRAVAARNVAIQVVLEDALLFKYINKGNTHHKAYAPQGLKYEDYEVPEGYGYDALCVEAVSGENTDKCCYAMIAVGDEALRQMAHAVSTIRENDSKRVKIFAFVHDIDAGSRAYHIVSSKAEIVELRPTIEKVRTMFGDGLQAKHDAMYSRMLLPLMGLTEKYERIVYLDNDVMVRGSLAELREMEVVNGMAATFDWLKTMGRRNKLIREPMPPLDDDERETLKKNTNEESEYINSGVLVFNRKTLPPDYVERLEHASRYARRVGHTSLPDQDLFNLEFDFDKFGDEYNKDACKADESTKVIHYLGTQKQELGKIVSDFLDQYSD